MIPKHLDSVCSKTICRDANCPHAVKEGPTGWFITMGHAGFNSLPNNRNGYRGMAAALSAMRRYLGKGGAPRDAQLTLRIPSPLKESIREIAAAEGRKPADMAVRILQTAVGRGWLKAVALALITLHASAFAIQPSMCISMCNEIARVKGFDCQVGPFEGRPMLFLTVPEMRKNLTPKISDAMNIKTQALTECFYAARGDTMEINSPNEPKRFIYCFPQASESGYGCRAAPAKDSYRKAAVASFMAWRAAHRALAKGGAK